MMSQVNVRRRFKNDDRSGIKSWGSEKKEPKLYKPVSTFVFVQLLALIVVVFTLTIVVEKRLPYGLKIADEPSNPGKFIAERAYATLQRLTKIGPRVAGSRENEIMAVDFLKNEIESVIAIASDNHVIEMEVQKVSGDFNLEFLDGMTNVYRDMQNVIVKVGSRIRSKHSLLINCHFDSVMNSPGASDDGAGCAVMMEILRVIAKSDRILRHNIIFLFNGGEENFMPASHGFITQHRWAKEIRAFINLEACGAGGREVLFQAGPHHPWILETYSEEVPYPFASSLAQEIFQSGVIPGDTDYRIFRDFGNISGLDFAWSANGYVYHTKFDAIEQIPLGSLQRTGDNILALALGMAQGHKLSQVELYRDGNLVFFDFLGAFVVRWPMGVADTINILTVIISLYTLYDNVKRAEITDYILRKRYVRKLLGCVGCVILSWILTLIVVLSIAFCLSSFGKTMSWYARPLWLVFLYIIPTFITCVSTVYLHAKYCQKDLELSPWTRFQFYYDAYQILWTATLAIGICLRIRSSFIALIWVIAATLGNIIKSKWYGKWRDQKWLLIHIGVMGLPFVQEFYMAITSLYLFVPIMGRAGATSYAEYLMAIMSSLQFSLLMCFAVPLILLVKRVERVLSLLVGLFLISLGVLLLTPLGFPYSGENNSLAPQRFMIVHAERVFHGIDGAVTNRSSGFWIVNMDINSPHTVDNYVPEMRRAKLIEEDCDDHLYCGLPYVFPVLTMFRKTHWIPAQKPKIAKQTTMKIMQREKILNGERVSIEIEGPPHIAVMLSPVSGVTVREWSFNCKYPLPGPLWHGRPTHFIYFTYGLTPHALKFSIDFSVPSNYSGPLMDFAVTGHNQFGPDKMTEELKQLERKFPVWTAVTSWSGTYESWII